VAVGRYHRKTNGSGFDTKLYLQTQQAAQSMTSAADIKIHKLSSLFSCSIHD